MTDEAGGMQGGWVYIASSSRKTKATATPDASRPDHARNELAYSVPWPGKTYIIVRRDINQSLSLKEDEPDKVFWSKQGKDRLNHWMIEADEASGFLNLRNAATRRYVGLDSQGRLSTQDGRYYSGSLFFVKHPEGGYLLTWCDLERRRLELMGDSTATKESRQSPGHRVDFIEV